MEWGGVMEEPSGEADGGGVCAEVQLALGLVGVVRGDAPHRVPATTWAQCEGYNQGYDQGYNQGYDKGYDQLAWWRWSGMMRPTEYLPTHGHNMRDMGTV